MFHVLQAVVDPVTEEVDVMTHYGFGRAQFEMAYVMPDMKTAYASIDGNYRPFFLFDADTPGDLSSGCLYAAKVHQTSDVDGTAVHLQCSASGFKIK